MSSCVAFGCKNRNARKGVKQLELEKNMKITFHKFPKDTARRDKWAEAVHRKGWAPSTSSVLCSQHFTDDCFDKTSLCVVRLRDNAVPSIFFDFPEHLQKKVHDSKKRHETELKRQHAERLSNRLDDIEQHTVIIKEEHIESVFVKRFPPNLCRICARSCEDLIDIFGDRAKEQELLDKIHTHLPITVTAEDELPVYICEDCIKNLDICHGLVKTCLNADATLKQMLDLPSEKNDAAVPTRYGSKELVPATSVNTQTQQLYVPAPAFTQNRELERQYAIPSRPLKTQDVLVQMMGNERNTGERVNEALAKVTPAKEVTVRRRAATENCSKPWSEISAAPSSEMGGETNSKFNCCDVCNLWFDDEEKYLKHKATNLCSYKCSHCIRNFPDQSQKEEHERLHTKEKKFVCGTCDKGFGFMGMLRRHLNMHNRVFACKVCGKVYGNRSGLYWHKWTHLDVTYPCPVCGEQVRKGKSAYIHRRKHANTCRKCGQKFSAGKLLEEHEKTTHYLCPNECNCCLKKLKKSCHVSLSCVDMWKCAFCPSALKTFGSLEAHMARKHKHKCFDCMQFFKDEEELGAHKQTQCREANHEGEVSGPIEPNRYSHSESRGTLDSRLIKYQTVVYVPCDVCGKVFSDKHRHNRHVVKCAGSLQHFRCPICGKGFTTKHRLLVHKQVHSRQKLYRCISCGKRFSFLNCLKKHCIISHPVSLNLLRSFSKKLKNIWK